jgi:serine/threonine protein kinase
MIGRQVGGYQIVELIGQGGMGNVFLAIHPETKKRAAIKVLRSELAHQSESVQRFFQEAKAINEIRHPHIIEFWGSGATEQGENYIVMEYLEGEPLSSAIKLTGPFTTERTCRVGQQICSALASAHRRGFIHRDLKPDNIYLIHKDDNDDFVKVLDFGIAKLDTGEDKLHTVTGSVLGTPLCMSPEQALGQKIDHRSDIYAVGVILYMMATRRAPLYDANPIVLANMHVNSLIPRPRERNADIDPTLEAIIMRCLAKERDQRYASIEETALALGSIEVAPNLYIPPQLSTHSIPVMAVAEIPLDTPSPIVAIQPTPASSLFPKQQSPYTRNIAIGAFALAMVAVFGFISMQQNEQTQIPTTPVTPLMATPNHNNTAAQPEPTTQHEPQSTSAPTSKASEPDSNPSNSKINKKKKKIGGGTIDPF